MRKILFLVLLILMLSACSKPVSIALPTCDSDCLTTTVVGKVSYEVGETIENNYKTMEIYVTFSGSPIYIFPYNHMILGELRRSGKEYKCTLYSVGNVSISTYGIGIHSVPLWYIKSYEEVGND
jgi:hypothetical protein